MADVSRVGVSGPLDPFVAGFVAELSRQGLQPVTARKTRQGSIASSDATTHLRTAR